MGFYQGEFIDFHEDLIRTAIRLHVKQPTAIHACGIIIAFIGGFPESFGQRETQDVLSLAILRVFFKNSS